MQSRWKRTVSVRSLWLLLSPNTPPPFTRAASGLMDILSQHQNKKGEYQSNNPDKQGGAGVFGELARRRPVPGPIQPYPKSPSSSTLFQKPVSKEHPPTSRQLPSQVIPGGRSPRRVETTNVEKTTRNLRKGDGNIRQLAEANDNRWMQMVGKKPFNGTNGERTQTPITTKTHMPSKKQKTITISDDITTKILAQKLGVMVSEVEQALSSLGEIPKSPEDPLSSDAAELVALEFDVIVQKIKSERKHALLFRKEECLGISHGKSISRPPVVTVMGHVDHGKTTLLDALRHTSVAEHEAGGITQHIGAFEVRLAKSGETLTFLDTPGHAAFSAMRARGAQVTDLVVLVVAADDGVMPQTKESLKFIRDARCPFVVAVTKCDLPQADISKVKRELGAESVELEENGGNVQLVEVAAPIGKGLDELQEALILQAMSVNLQSLLDVPATAIVVEANKSRGLGPVATVIITDGTLRTGDAVVVGHHWGKIKQMKTCGGTVVKDVTAGRPVELSGLRSVPQPGDELTVVRDEDRAKRVSAARLHREHLLQMSQTKNENEEEQRTVPFLIKADTQGTGEAVNKAMNNLASDVVSLLQHCPWLGLPGQIAPEVMSCSVGSVTEADIEFAKTTGARILAFNTKPQGHEIVTLAQRKEIEIHQHEIIYRLLDDVGKVLLMSAPECEDEEITGEALVRKMFNIKIKRSKPTLSVAGCLVRSGSVQKSSPMFRVLREERVVFEGVCTSLKREKTDVDAVGKGIECGIALDSFECEEGDVIQNIVKRRRPPKTETVIGGGLRVVEFSNV